MKKINLAITGCLGRMGQQLIKSSKSNKVFKLASLTENKPINKKIAGIKIDLNTDLAFEKSDIIIDFTVPKCTLEILKIASRLKKRVVIGTTGFTQKEENLIKKYSKNIPILKAGNMSLGINLLMYLTEITSSSLKDEYLSKIFEIHHKHKKDYPSGEIIGEHEVIFSSGKETISLNHEAFDRSLYSDGALEAAKWLINKRAGLYSMRDLMNFR